MLRRHRSLAAPVPTSVPVPRTDDRPQPPDEANHLVIVVLDSLRHDSCMAADMPNLARIGDLEQRWSYASWTAPSHYNLLMGLLPHRSPANVFASDYYKEDFTRYTERLNVPDMEFKRLLPALNVPTFLRDSLGYRTSAMVSMPVLNPATSINVGFDAYELMPRHNDMSLMLDQLRFDGDRPWFHLLNVGETHYPYALPDDDVTEWPRISGVHGVFKHLDDATGNEGDDSIDPFFDSDQMAVLRQRQVRAATYVDRVIGRLLDEIPERTWVVVTSDHGELFGEGGYFGHGPIAHEKVFEVPFAEGRVR